MAVDDVLRHVTSTYPDLTQAQKRIAEAIVEKPEFVAFATIDKFATELGIAPSTIVRFAYRLGLDGYPDLQERVRRIVRTRIQPVSGDGTSERVASTRLGGEIVSSSATHDLQNLERTIRDVDPDALAALIDSLTSSNRVYLVGGFASDWLAEYFALSINRVRGGAHPLTRRDAAAQMLDMGVGDLLVAFSFPPYASDTLSVVQAAKRRGVAVAAITDSPIAPIAREAAMLLTAHVSGVGPQNSLVAPVMLLNALLNAVADRSENCSERYREVFEQMDEWGAFILKSDTATNGE